MSEIVAVQTVGVVKGTGERRVVDEVDLLIERGSFVVITGLAGSGKTSLLRMISGLLRPDGGEVSVDGHHVWPDPEVARGAIGVVADIDLLFDRLTIAEQLEYAGLLRGLTRGVVAKRVPELCRLLDLRPSGRLLADVSPGVRRRTSLAAAVVHAPVILIADEPLVDQAESEIETVTRTLSRYHAAGGTVVVAADDPSQLARLAQRVVVLEAGRIRADGLPEELTEIIKAVSVQAGSDKEATGSWLSTSSASS